jgi:hypothetical protein
MMNKKTMHKKSPRSKKALLGVGILASIAGIYFLYGGSGAKNNRKKVKGWVLKAKGEILEKLEKTKDVTQEQYDNMIDSVLVKYEAVKNIDPKELELLGKDLKRHWKSFKKELKKVKNA